MRKSTLIFLLAALALAAGAIAQSITGDLVVNVTDSSGGAVSGAALNLVQVETNVKLSAVTDSLGNYLFVQLKPGRYTLEAGAPGFQRANLTDIAIAIGQRSHVDAKLTVGAVNEAVSVSAAAETLLTESASVGQV
ncbi:MAG TPA: carboxypeptidase-like regulatory domain-containing protein, partial [Candidatus Solibacter sp.]|nr:carboxypeptidase-like regulatory domain-containing protein [Candidatus Solibacter sp.]